MIKYQSHMFGVTICMNDYGYAMAEGYSAEKNGGNNKFLEYVLATLRLMLSEEDSMVWLKKGSMWEWINQWRNILGLVDVCFNLFFQLIPYLNCSDFD